MKVIAIANQKGGIGKTTTATITASILQEKGFKTLLIDADESANSTDVYKASVENTATLYDVLVDNDRVPIHEAIQHTPSGDIVAGDALLTRAEVEFKTDVEGLYRFKDAVEALGEYDYVIIDTHPSINSMLQSVLIAADEIVVPITAERFSITGLEPLLSTIRVIQKRINPKLKIAGFLLIKYNKRTILSREILDLLNDVSAANGTRLFETKIREAESVRKSQVNRVPLIKYDPKATATIDYYDYVEELIS